MTSWVRGKCIGKGAFGTVSVAVRKHDGRVFAVKSVDRKTGHHAGQLEALENEIRILRRMSSPYVVAFLGDDATTDHRNLHEEYLPGGTVADLDDDVDERVVRRYTWCLANALRHVHSHGVAHCDVKGRNVLVGPNGRICKLADFGSAAEFSGEGFPAEGVSPPRGSPLWMAPEVIRREYQGPESDVWSLGCTVIEMVTGKTPWEDRGVDSLSRIGYSDELQEFPSRLSELGRDFLEKCLRREPRRRWSCDQLLRHPFLLAAPTCDELVESSPRCVLDWVDSEFAEFDDGEELEEEEEEGIGVDSENSAKGRICKLASSLRANWETEGWVAVRALVTDAEPTTTVAGVGGCGDEGEGICWEYSEMMRVEEGIEVGTSSEYLGLKNERVESEMWKLGGRRRCMRRRDDGDSECNRNRSERESETGWSCRYGNRSENVDRIRGITIIYSLCCKLLKSYFLFSIYLNIYLCFWIIYIDYLLWACEKTCSLLHEDNFFFDDQIIENVCN